MAPITWSENFRILEAGSPHSPQAGHGPGLVVYNGFLHVVYVGEGNKNLWLARLTSPTDFHKWEQNQQIKIAGASAPQSSDRPALAVTNNLLHMVYQGQGGTDLWWAWFDGESWAGNVKLPSAFQLPAGPGQYSLQQTRPSLCVGTNGALHLLYHAYLVPLPNGGVQNQLLHATFTPRPKTTPSLSDWSSPDVVSRDKNHPAILQFGQSLAMTSTIAINVAGNDVLQFAQGNPGAWGNFTPLHGNVLSTDGGVLVEFNNLLYVVYIGQSHRKIWYAWMDANAALSESPQGNMQVKNAGWEADTSAAVSAAAMNGELCIAYKGQSSDNLWFAHGH